MSAGYTPGPWICDGPVLEFEGARFGEVAYVLSKDGECFDATDANARLIASAPELLEALATLRDYVSDAASGALIYVDSGEGFLAMAKEDMARIDAAIAKATTP